MEFLYVSALNGLSYGLLLFVLSAGLTLVFSMLGVVNFAHAGFYMLGAYVAWSASRVLGFWPALVLTPLVVGVLGGLFERLLLRRTHKHGHVTELLLTFGLSFVVVEVVQLLWGRAPIDFAPPPSLQGAAFTFVHVAGGSLDAVWGSAPAALCRTVGATCSPFPATRAFMMIVSLVMLVFMALVLRRTRIGLVVQAALENPSMLGALGHDVDRVFMIVFGAGAALAALAGVVGGVTFVTEPGMAGAVGSVVFVVVVVGGLGSLTGSLLAALGIGMLQTFAVALDTSIGRIISSLGLTLPGELAQALGQLITVTSAQIAPLLPFMLLVAMLVMRPRGLLGRRET